MWDIIYVSVVGPDPDPYVFGPPGSEDPLARGTVPDSDLLSSSKNGKKNLNSYCFVTSL